MRTRGTVDRSASARVVAAAATASAAITATMDVLLMASGDLPGATAAALPPILRRGAGSRRGGHGRLGAERGQAPRAAAQHGLRAFGVEGLREQPALRFRAPQT